MSFSSIDPPRIGLHPAALARPTRGFTFVELLVTLSIVFLLACAALPSFLQGRDRRALEAAASELAADLRAARTEAVAREAPVVVTVAARNGLSCYALHTGSPGACDCTVGPTPARSSCAPGVEDIKTRRLPGGGPVALQSNVASLVFDASNGTVTPAGTLTLTGSHAQAVRHIVNVMGRVRSCVLVPDGLAAVEVPSGYPRC